jgi:hypothetical protein
MYRSAFLALALVGGDWSASYPCHYTLRETAPSTHWIGGWVGPRAGLDNVEKRILESNSDPSVVQPTVSHYIECTIKSR